jgi:hypothetical protein
VTAPRRARRRATRWPRRCADTRPRHTQRPRPPPPRRTRSPAPPASATPRGPEDVRDLDHDPRAAEAPRDTRTRRNGAMDAMGAMGARADAPRAFGTPSHVLAPITLGTPNRGCLEDRGPLGGIGSGRVRSRERLDPARRRVPRGRAQPAGPAVPQPRVRLLAPPRRARRVPPGRRALQRLWSVPEPTRQTPRPRPPRRAPAGGASPEPP